MRSKSLLTLVVALSLCTFMLSASTLNVFSLFQSDQYVASLQAATRSQADEPIVGLNFRAEGDLSAGQPVTFVAEVASGTNIRFRWDFGDGASPSQGASVVHTFPGKGVYNVTLIAENSISIKTATRQIDISRQALPPPVITISGSRRVDVPMTFQATVNTNANVEITWEFGDGEAPSTDNPATHRYDSVGTFVVTANVVNLNDPTDRSSATELITVVDQPIVGWSSAPSYDANNKREATQPITFRAEVSAGTNVSYRWNFGDGTPSKTTQTPNIIHRFAAPGIFKVTVNAYNSVSNIDNSIDNPLFIEVDPLLEELDESPTIECVPTEGLRRIICFAMVNKGEPATFSWNFGDGATALGRIVDHSYAEDGKYGVRVTVKNQHPTKNLVNVMDVVEIVTPETPVVGANPLVVTTNPDPSREGEMTFFTLSRPITGTVNYLWSFGDDENKVVEGNSSLAVFHKYEAAGQFVVNVTGIDAAGNTIDSIDTPILVSQAIRIPLIIKP